MENVVVNPLEILRHPREHIWGLSQSAAEVAKGYQSAELVPASWGGGVFNAFPHKWGTLLLFVLMSTCFLRTPDPTCAKHKSACDQTEHLALSEVPGWQVSGPPESPLQPLALECLAQIMLSVICGCPSPPRCQASLHSSLPIIVSSVVLSTFDPTPPSVLPQPETTFRRLLLFWDSKESFFHRTGQFGVFADEQVLPILWKADWVHLVRELHLALEGYQGNVVVNRHRVVILVHLHVEHRVASGIRVVL